jgi:hypothetical protein
MVGGTLFLIALTSAIPEPAPLTSSTLERVAFAFVDEEAKAEASEETTPEPDVEDSVAVLDQDATVLRDVFTDSRETSAREDEDKAPDFAKLLGSWHPTDPWERTLVALQTPKAAIHFDEIMANARTEEETQAAIAQTGAALTARTEVRAHGASLADAEACAAAAIVATGLLVAVVVLLWSLRRVQRSRDELRLRTEALLVLASIIKSTESRPWAAELQLILRQALRDRRSSECIRQVLRRHRELRLRALAPSSGT